MQTADTSPIKLSADHAWATILHLVHQPDVNALALIVANAAEAQREPGVQNTLDLVTLAGRLQVLVICEKETPFEDRPLFPNNWRANDAQ